MSWTEKTLLLATRTFFELRNCLERFFTETVQIVQQKLSRVIYGFLRVVYDCYELFTSHLRKHHSVDTREKIFDLSKNLLLLSRILKSVCELCRAIYGYQRVTYGCLRVTTSWPSVTTRKKNPCMWTPCKLITDVVRHLYLWYKSSWLPDTAWALWDRDGRRVGLHQGSAVDSDVGRNTSSPGRFWRPLNSRHSRDPLAYIDQTSFVHSALSPSVLAALGRDSWR